MEYTKEDLMNTWGVVESKEHAEYIVKVADSAGLSLLGVSNSFGGFFAFSDVSLIFIVSGCVASWGCKKITIPLPPKEKEWPQVGDEVLTVSGVMLDVLAVYGESVWVKYQDGRNDCTTLHISNLRKSKQDLLIEELHQKLLANNCSDEYLLACDIVQGKIEGLSYNP